MDGNATMTRFGDPDSRLAESDHWVLLVRPHQPTLGALVLAAKGEATRFGAIDPAAHADLAMMVPRIEAMLDAALAPERINYLMLMMVDPHVHFHVIPRHSGTRALAGLVLADAGWPGPPDLKGGQPLDAAGIAAVKAALLAHWPRQAGSAGAETGPGNGGRGRD